VTTDTIPLGGPRRPARAIATPKDSASQHVGVLTAEIERRVPARLDARGVPVGTAVAGPYLVDGTTLAVARLLEVLLLPPGRPPHDKADPEHASGTARGSS
jgi:hypothetical protein